MQNQRRWSARLLFAAMIAAGCSHASSQRLSSTAGVLEFDPPPPSPELISISARADELIAKGDFKEALSVFQDGWTRGIWSPETAFAASGAAARAGLVDEGFAWLVRASELGYHDVTQIDLESGLAALRDDPRWLATRERLVSEAEAAQRREGASNLPLARELAKLVKEDQEARLTMIHTHSQDPVLVARVKEVDRQHLPRLRELFAQYGWPGKHLVGKVGSQNAWTLVQHMDCDPHFQRQALDLMAPAVEAGEASKRRFAYLTDRVLRAEKKPQRYGTQFEIIDGTWMPKEMEDPAHVDERRKSMGLGSMVEAAAHMELTYGSPALAVRKPGAIDRSFDDWCSDRGG